jgi:hypothetical protein
LKKQEAIEKRDLETQAAMKEEYEEYEITLKRQSKRLKEALASKRLRDQQPEALASLERTYSVEDLETLASLKRTYEPPVKIQRLTCEFQHVLLVDELTAKRMSPGAEAIASHHRGLAKAKVDMLLAKAKVRSLKRQ